MIPTTVPAWTMRIDGATYTVTPAGHRIFDVWRAEQLLGSFELRGDTAEVASPDRLAGRQVRAIADAFIAASHDERVPQPVLS